MKLNGILTFCIGFVWCSSQVEINGNDSLRILAIRFEPFISYHETSNNFKGIEFNLVKVLAEKLNLTLSIQYETKTIGLDSIDIIIGGMPIGNKFNLNFNEFSVPYFQDDLTWCVQHSGYFPGYLNLFVFASPECWFIVIFGFLIVAGTILFIFIQFDNEYEYRNKRDWHYTSWLITLPALIGSNQRYQPIHMPLRCFYAFLLLMGIVINGFIMSAGMKGIRTPLRKHQVSTVAEIFNGDYHLYGFSDCLTTLEVREKWKIEKLF